VPAPLNPMRGASLSPKFDIQAGEAGDAVDGAELLRL